MTGRDTLLIDGRCRVCVHGSRRLQRWVGADALDVADANDPEQRRRFDEIEPTRFEREMVLVTAGGGVLGGYDALARVMGGRRGFGWLGRLMRLPGLRHLGRAAYRLFAANRHRFGKHRCGACRD